MRLPKLLLPLVPILLISAPLRATPTRPRVEPAAAKNGECHKTAVLARKARIDELQSEFKIALANATNLTDPALRKQAIADAKDELKSGIQDAHDQYLARLDLCAALGGGAYDPAIDPGQFVAGVTNPFFPLVVGRTLTYVNNPVGDTVTTTAITNQTKTILGVTCMVVHDTVKVNNVMIEDTLDYYAQDLAGNVWYFGELSLTFADGEVASLEGSWTAGVDGAKPGIIMEAAPAIDDTYRQEFFLGTSEDAATVLSLTASVTVPYGNFPTCLQTRDFSPLEPDADEHKFYAQGIGVVLEVELSTGERTELTSVTP